MGSIRDSSPDLGLDEGYRRVDIMFRNDTGNTSMLSRGEHRP